MKQKPESTYGGTDDFSTMPEDAAMAVEDDSGDYLAWLAGVRDLRERLTRR